MAQNDLCTLGDVKAWLGRTDTNSDAVLASLITRTSRQILSYLRRPTVLPHTVNEVCDGTGGDSIMLREWPVLSITSLTIGGETIPPAPTWCGAGFLLEPWDGVPPGRSSRLAVKGFCLPRGVQNVSVSYRAGYQVSAESQAVTNGALTVIAPCGNWAADGGVTYADETPLVQVSGAPGPGQYQLTPDAPGSYTFNTGDNGQTVLITYGYVPADLADASIELVGERFKYAQRIGETSHSLGGNETVAFDNARFTPLVAQFLAPYRHVLPI